MSQYLFHGTSIYAVMEIAKSNRIQGGANDDFHEGVSLTRSLDMAGDFANTNDVMWRDHMGWDNKAILDLPETTGAVLVFDRAQLESAFDLTEVDFYAGEEGRDEEEERTNGDIAPADEFIRAIIMNLPDLEVFEQICSMTGEDCSAVIAQLQTSGLLITPEQGTATFG